jgi:FkbM family methyltransferase
VTGNLIDWTAFFNGVYEKQWLEFCLRQIGDSRSAVFLDIGGNVGHHALWFAAQGCRVHTFEPFPALWPTIKGKCGLPGVAGTITVHRTAMGSTAETRTFNLPESVNQGTGSFEQQPYNWSGNRIELQISAASDYLRDQGIGNASLIKIDVEGFDLDVLTGLKAFLARTRPVLWVKIIATAPGRPVDMKMLRGVLSGDYRFYYAVRRSPLLTAMKFVETDEIPGDGSIDIVAVPV